MTNPTSGNLSKFGNEASTHMFREALQLSKAMRTRANYIQDGVGGNYKNFAEPTFNPTLEDNGLRGRDVSMQRLKNQNGHICSYQTAVHFNPDMNMRELTVTYNCESVESI